MTEPTPSAQPELPEDDDRGGVFLSWRGRKRSKILVPLPRILETIDEASDPTDEDPGNLIIEGDNKQAMASLRYLFADQIDVVLIDPPYNTGKDDFRYSDKRYDDPDADESAGAYVSGTERGRHTKWLNEMAPTLRLIHDLMSPSGVIFVHINDIELPRLLMLMEEVFTDRNHLGTLVWKSATDNNPSQIVVEHEYIVAYAKDRERIPSSWRGDMVEARADLAAVARKLIAEESSLARRQVMWKEYLKVNKARLGSFASNYRHFDTRGPFMTSDLSFPGGGGPSYDVVHPVAGKPTRVPPHGYRVSQETMEQYLAEGRVHFGKDENSSVLYKRYLDDKSDDPLRSVITSFGGKGVNADVKRLFPDQPDVFPSPKPVALEEYLLSFVAGMDVVVLDCYAGSGTTGHAVMRLNKRDGGRRRFILIERGEKDDQYATSLTAERIRRARTIEGLPGGFTFKRVGARIDEDGLLNMERSLVAEAVLMADASGRGGGIKAEKGELVIGRNRRGEAIALSAGIHTDQAVTGAELRAMLEESERLGLKTPMRVYGVSCEVYEDDLFSFFQLPDEIMRNLYSGRGMSR